MKWRHKLARVGCIQHYHASLGIVMAQLALNQSIPCATSNGGDAFEEISECYHLQQRQWQWQWRGWAWA